MKFQFEVQINPKIDAICCIAGRDSIAAVIRACELHDFKNILPVITIMPTEYGDHESILKNINVLKRIIKKRFDGRILEPIYMEDTIYWSILNGRYISDIISKFKIYSPCIGCHLYMHTLRAIIANNIKCKYVISGSRELHETKRKINQNKNSLELYNHFYSELGVVHLTPLQNINDGDIIEQMIGVDWKEGEKQLRCVFNGNYFSHVKKIHPITNLFESYINNYLLPLNTKLLQYKLNNIGFDMEQIDEAIKLLLKT